MALSGGVLQALEQMDRMSNFSTEPEGRTVAEETRMLRKQILRLRERKEQLLSNRRWQKQKILCDSFTERPLPDTPRQTENDPEKARLLEKEFEVKKLQALAAAYRLTGLSCETIKGDKKSNLLLRWDPSFRGHFMESFYAQVQMLHQCKLVHHTLPVFVPVEDLEKSLKVSVAEFGAKVTKYLQAFVARRHIALQLKESIPPEYLEAEVHTTAAANCIQLELSNLPHSVSSLVVLLIFDDLTRFHVTRVLVKNKRSESEEGLEKIAALKENLMKEDVVECLKNFLDGSSP